MKDALVDIFAAAYVKAILAGVATLVYNAIAPEFNLPTFNFFIFYGLYWCVPPLFKGINHKDKD